MPYLLDTVMDVVRLEMPSLIVQNDAAPQPACAATMFSGPSAAGSGFALELALLSGLQRQAHTEEAVMRVVRELGTSATEALSAATPLMEAGIDSLAATELSSRLQSMSGVALSPTLLFEYPTARDIGLHVLSLALGPDEQPMPSRASRVPRPSDGVSTCAQCMLANVGRWSAGCNEDPGRWQLMIASGDAATSVPTKRWTLEEMVDVSALSVAQVACSEHGAFLLGAQRFDSHVFGQSRVEAGVMDPQQRLLLEFGYMALHAALERRTALMGDDGGVFVGIERPDWTLVQPPAMRTSVFSMAADNVSVAAGRLSFVLGLQGPCSSVDAACASSLVALHSASHAVSGRECIRAVAQAVSLKLAPHMTLGMASVGMLSVDGRCKTLDTSANGMVRTEGIGALTLTSAAEGKPACSLRSVSVRQDGRSASLTAPNGSAQRTLLLATLGRAALMPAEVGCAELHGTGTPLGDPTEAGSLAAVYSSLGREVSLAVGAAKASVGHSEAASGQIGLLRARQVLEMAVTAGNTKLRCLNPLVLELLSSSDAHFALPTHGFPCTWTATCGVSSFGFSGTIVHALLASTALAPLKLDACTLKVSRSTFTWMPRPSDAQRASSHVCLHALCWVPASDASLSRQAAHALLLCPAASHSPRCGHSSNQAPSPSLLALALMDSHSTASSMLGTQLLLGILQHAIRSRSTVRTVVLTHRTQVIAPLDAAPSVSTTAHGAAWGIGRVLRLEHPTELLSHCDLAGHINAGIKMLSRGSEVEMAYCSISAPCVARLRQDAPQRDRRLLRHQCDGGAFLLSGGACLTPSCSLHWC